MKKPLFYIGVLLMCWCWLAPTAQGNDTLLVRMLFSDQDSLHWLKEYNGFFNGKHPVRFTLACNGTAIRGVSHYLQSSNKFYLRGQLNHGKWYLEEQDELFRSSAQLMGQESDYSLLLDWHTL